MSLPLRARANAAPGMPWRSMIFKMAWSKGSMPGPALPVIGTRSTNPWEGSAARAVALASNSGRRPSSAPTAMVPTPAKQPNSSRRDGFLWLRAILLPLFWCSAVELEEVFESGDATFRKPSAPSRLEIGVVDFVDCRETSDYTEVSHEQEVHCSTVR